MTKLARLGGLLADAALGLPLRATPFAVERDLAAPMPDGVSLLGDLYRPVGASGPLPVVLIRLPYGRAGANGQFLGASLARRGFQVFMQSNRGTFGSGGHFRPFTTEHEDGLATVAWLREQGLRVADSDANFCLFGTFPDRHAVWQGLLDRGVLVRDVGVTGWLRVSAGTPEETDAFLAAMEAARDRSRELADP